MNQQNLTISPNRQQTGLLTEIPQEVVWLANFISPNTKKSYSQSVREFIAFHGITSAEDLKLIDQAHIISWRDSLIGQGIASRTVNARISALSSLFKHLCEKQVISRNPTTGVKRPRINSKEVQAPTLTASQVRKMLDSPDTSNLKGLRDKAILHIFFYSGCRISEISSLKIKDFYEDGGYFVLNFKVKGGKRNKIAIHHELQIALRRYLEKTGHSTDSNSYIILPLRPNRFILLQRFLNIIIVIIYNNEFKKNTGFI